MESFNNLESKQKAALVGAGLVAMGLILYSLSRSSTNVEEVTVEDKKETKTTEKDQEKQKVVEKVEEKKKVDEKFEEKKTVVQKIEEKNTVAEKVAEVLFWVDKLHENERYLKKIEAEARVKIISDISYKLSFALVANSDSFFGFQSANFTLSQITEDVFFDFKGRKILKLVMNGK